MMIRHNFSAGRGLRALAGCLVILAFLSACGLAPIPNTGPAAVNGSSAAVPTMANMVMNTSTPGQDPTNTAVPIKGPHVTIDNFTFSPATLTVPVGTTVTWINQDDTVHTVTSVDHRFGSQGLDTGDTFSFQFSSPGTYAYYCSIHPKMEGKIIVK
jgi:plastocyanin